MIARTELAILHFNSVQAAKYAITKAGKQIYKHQFSKITNSWVVKKVRGKPEKKYLVYLLEEVERLKVSREKSSLPNIVVPKNIAPVEKPNKDDSIKNLKSRFK